MDCSPPGSSVHGILQARLLEWKKKKKKNTGVGSHSFLQGNLPDPGIEPASPALQAGYSLWGHKELNMTKLLTLSLYFQNCYGRCVLHTIMYCNESVMRCKVHWKSKLPLSWTWLILTSFCHVLWLRQSSRGFALPSFLLFQEGWLWRMPQKYKIYS